MASTNYFNKGEAKARYGRQPTEGINFKINKEDNNSPIVFQLKQELSASIFQTIRLNTVQGQEILEIMPP